MSPSGVNQVSRSFSDRVVVITGGSSGIGLSLASDLSDQGAHVVIVSHDALRLGEAEEALRRSGRNVSVFLCDVRSSEQTAALAAHVSRTWGRTDILINNAGYAVYRPFEESTTEEVLDLLDVNLAGAMRCTKAFLPGMLERRSGRIVNVASIGGATIITPNAVYCAAKHGMVAWSLAMRYELERFGLHVNVVCPGHTSTHFHDHPTFRRRDADRRPGRRSLTSADVSAAVLDGIRRNRVITYVPSWHRFLAWSLRVAPPITAPIWRYISLKRVDQLYRRMDAERRNRGV